MTRKQSPDHRSDAAIRLSEEQLRFLDGLAKATQPLGDPAEVMQLTARMLGRHLGVNRCAYAEVLPDQDHFDLIGDYNDGVSSIVGHYTFTAFGLDVLRLMRANEAYVVDDVDTDPRTAGTDLTAYRLTEIRAVICVPLHKNGRFVAAMAVHQRVPRQWRPEDVDLVQLVVGRCWESLERTRAQRALESSNARLGLALSAGALGDWSWDAASDLVTLSDRAAEIWGLPAGETIAWAEMQKLLHPDDREPTVQAVTESVRTGQRYVVEYRLAHVQPERWVSVWGSPQLDESGAAVGILGVLQDATARKEMEQRLRDRADELGEADRRKDEFLAVLAHELRNPLAPIGLAAEMLRAGRVSGAALDRTAEVIRSQVKHMARLLDDLMDASRIRTGNLRMKMETVLASGIVDIALQNAGPLLKSRRHEVSVEVPPELRLRADPVRMAQVVSNLLTNAAKYTDINGRVSLTVRALPDGRCEFAVGDSGIGLSADARERIFEMFSQESSALERSEGGLGIGLALVRAIVQLHGGTVEASSDGPGRGSRFSVRVPGVATAAPAATPASPVHHAPRPERLNILLADDNASGVELLRELLESEGHRVSSATDGAQALALANMLKPAVAILDIGMPKLNGYEVAKAIRMTDWGAAAYLIAATGWGQETDKARAGTAGFDLHLTKPFDPMALLEVLNGLCAPARSID